MSVVSVDTDTGEVLSGDVVSSSALAKPDIARPGEPISLAHITAQCRSIEVWAEHCDSIPDITDARNKLAAIEQYVAATSKDGRAQIAAAQRRLEIRIGILLGPAKAGNPTGANQHGGTSLASEVPPTDAADSALSANERSQFRNMADHPDIVEAVIDESDDESPASRRRTLDEINRAKHAPPGDPTPEEIHARTVTLVAKELHKAGQLFAMFTPEQIHALNDPDITRGVTELMKVIAPWWETYKATKPTGLVVHQGGKQ